MRPAGKLRIVAIAPTLASPRLCAWRTGAAVVFPVDDMIVSASLTLLSDARRGAEAGVLPGSLLILGLVAYRTLLSRPDPSRVSGAYSMKGSCPVLTCAFARRAIRCSIIFSMVMEGGLICGVTLGSLIIPGGIETGCSRQRRAEPFSRSSSGESDQAAPGKSGHRHPGDYVCGPGRPRTTAVRLKWGGAIRGCGRRVPLEIQMRLGKYS